MGWNNKYIPVGWSQASIDPQHCNVFHIMWLLQSVNGLAQHLVLIRVILLNPAKLFTQSLSIAHIVINVVMNIGLQKNIKIYLQLSRPLHVCNKRDINRVK